MIHFNYFSENDCVSFLSGIYPPKVLFLTNSV